MQVTDNVLFRQPLIKQVRFLVRGLVIEVCIQKAKLSAAHEIRTPAACWLS